MVSFISLQVWQVFTVCLVKAGNLSVVGLFSFTCSSYLVRIFNLNIIYFSGKKKILARHLMLVGPVAQSVQLLATGWTVRGSNPGGGEIFRTCPDRPWGPPSLLYNGYRVFPGVKSGRGVTLTPHPLLVPLVMKEQSYTSTLPLDRTVCTEPQCLYKYALYLYLFYLICSILTAGCKFNWAYQRNR